MVPALMLLVALAVLPPPPEPDTAAEGGAADGGFPWATVGTLTALAVLALAAGLYWFRVRRGRRPVAPSPPAPPPAPHRIERWDGAEATVLGRHTTRAAADAAFAHHLRAATAAGASGSLVLIADATDEMVVLRPLTPEPPNGDPGSQDQPLSSEGESEGSASDEGR